tara:strand:- start:371 stop:616 length:246 start_codon:yes stop_codon:yes gene_type:complete
MGSIFGIAKRGFGMLKKAKKAIVDEPLLVQAKDLKKNKKDNTAGSVIKMIIKKKGPKAAAMGTAASVALSAAKNKKNKKGD